jgi:hypothetical protein
MKGNEKIKEETERNKKTFCDLSTCDGHTISLQYIPQLRNEEELKPHTFVCPRNSVNTDMICIFD